MHLHAHSYYSFLAGTLSLERLVAYAQRNGHAALALTDTNNVTGATEFVTRCREAGIQPIVGADVRAGASRAVLLARNWDGYQRLCEVVTHAAAQQPPARITEDAAWAEDATLRADAARRSVAEADAPARNGRSERIELVDILEEFVSDDLVVMTEDRGVLEALRPLCARDTLYAELVPARESRWPALLRDAERLRVPLVAANDVYFGEPGGRTLHSVLRAISTNTTMGTLDDTEVAHPSQYFMSEEETRALFHSLPTALENRACIAALCDLQLDFTTSKFTTFGNRTADEKHMQLRALAEKGAAGRYPAGGRDVHDRLEKEFRIIAELGFADYFLVAWDLVRYAKHRNYPYVGRGSGANSIVAYCLEITNVDPIELDLFFERFLNPERKSPPDFDIDFSWRNRDDVIDYVLGKYGHERTAMICTLSTYSPRGAMRETGKALGYSEAEVKQCTSLLSSYGSARDLHDPQSPFRRHAGVILQSEYGARWIALATRILDFPNHYGIHSGGVILAPEKMTRYTATQIAPKGVRITQQDMFSIEDWRLEKLDILSTRGLGTFEDTMRAVEKKHGHTPPVLRYTNACEDAETRRIMREGKTIGCFYVESPAMIQLLRKLRTDTFEMLTAASSIIRPGVAQSGMMQAFIERYHDTSKIRPPHPKMAELLHSTFGVMVYQEDVIKVAHFIGGMSLGEADVLRRAMSGKMRSQDAMRALKDGFFRGCASRGIDESVTAEIWRQMESFAGYSFCKAHSASYAVLSFQEAYLKAHYPAYFLCAVLNNQGGYYRPEVYVQEARRLNISILLPSVNESATLHTCPDESTIQLGFLHVKGLSDRSEQALLAARQEVGRFNDIQDFLARGGVTFEDACILIRCGACDCLGGERPAMLVLARLFLARGGAGGTPELPLERPLFDDELSGLRPYSTTQIAEIELETFSYTVSAHVLENFREQLAGTKRAGELASLVGRRVSVGGWMVAAKMSRTKKGERMMFMNLDDSTGMIDVVVFPKCYHEFGHLLRSAGPYLVTGRVAREYGVINVVAEKIERLAS
ncbi:MAG: DNA polymerase III subunit alpha [Ignavibacteriae bacterium]|nr:DNA polymerase III subunit alpha [Ignavibacteriota bacterium]